MLKGKTALVTGSTSGIGLGIAEKLAAQGVNVILNGFGEVDAPKAAVVAAGQAFGIKVGYHGADMSKPAEIEAMMAYAQAEFGGVDILVNNAGIQHVAKVEDFPVEKWDETYTSKMAMQTLVASGVKKKQRRDKKLLDQISATIILQEYLQNL